jgi:predicted methyltransferase
MRFDSTRWLWLVVLVLLVCAGGWAETPTGNEEEKASGASPELNARFVDPELDVDEWIERFEVESREVYAARNEVLRATGIRAGSRVADIGAGTGFFTRMFAEAAGSSGWVYAVEISPRFLEHINRWASDADADNVTAILGRTDDISLPPGSVDLVFICDTYHHFEAVVPTLASIRRALAPGGVLVLIDFEKIPGKSSEFIMGHVRAGKEVFRAEIEAQGFAFVEEVELPALEENYLLKFKRE